MRKTSYNLPLFEQSMESEQGQIEQIMKYYLEFF